MRVRLLSFRGASAVALCIWVLGGGVALGQPRMYNVQWTNTAPTLDGVVGAGEWAAAAPAQGNWNELRQPETDMDTANNRFQMMWDASGLYILHQVDQTIWSPPAAEMNPNISFSLDSLNLYLDPNLDDEPNFIDNPDGFDLAIDGYQVAFNEFEGTLLSTNADRQGVGFFTEAHIDAGFGDQARWNRGGSDVAGAALQDIVVAQKNDATGGVAEMYFPWSNFNADGPVPPLGDYNQNGSVDAADFTQWRDTLGDTVTTPGEAADGDQSGIIDQPDYGVWKTNFGVTGEPGISGLYHPFAPTNNDTWFYQMGQITTADANNFLPVYAWTPSQGFTAHPHAEITFVGRPAAGVGAAVPEPASVVLVLLASFGLATLPRRT